MRVPAVLVAAAAVLLPLPPSAAQEVRVATAVTPDTVTVGDRFRVAVRVSAAPGARVEFPEHPEPADATQGVAPAQVLRDAARGEHTALYTLVAWRTGRPVLPPLPVRVAAGGGTREVPVRLPLPYVRSVLPADTAGVEPRGPHDVLGAGRSLWPYLLAAAVAALLLLGLFFHLRRRRPAPVVAPHAPGDPRARALAELERAHRLRLLERGEWKAYYALTSGALRGYLAALSPRWGTDLTSAELLRRMREEASAEEASRLEALLREADLVKFARARPPAEEAERHHAEARRWVESFAPRRREETAMEGAA